MSRSSGPGSPCWFRCASCRRANGAWAPKTRTGWRSRVRLTGRTRNRRHASTRHGVVMREYVCQDCKHIGWSTHNDLADLPMTGDNDPSPAG